MTEATNMMSAPHTQTQVQYGQPQQQQQRITEGESQGQTQIGEGGVQFGDLNMRQLSKEVQNRIMPVQRIK